jgi:hypothetical protein
MDLKIALNTILEQSGSTADEVAATLKGKGVQGIRNAVRVLNPIVRYVQNATRIDNLDVDVMTGKTLRVHANRSHKSEEITLPQAVREFMEAFNRGTYPELELPHDKT